MSENPTPATPETSERYKVFIVVLTLITTVIAAIVTTLQADANIRASQFNRDSQYYAILASGELQRSGLQTSYDTHTYTRILQETQIALNMKFTAMQSETSGDMLGVALSDLEALAAQARADKLKNFSIFYSDPRFAPGAADGFPNIEAYIADSNLQAIQLVQKQNVASDEYHKWSRKADTYVSVLAVMALAFLLFGLAQSLSGRMRLVFAIFGMVILLGASIWTILILLA